jgi:hypothetical protein
MVRRVYLDQNKWIDIARAAHGRAGGERYADAWLLARSGVEMGLLEFPLSTVTYMETMKRREWRSRQRLASVMIELSQMRTMVSSWQLIPGEIDRALKNRWGRPPTPREVAVFGRGVGHAFGYDGVNFEIPDLVRDRLSEDDRQRIVRQANELIEQGILAGPAADWPQDGIDPAGVLAQSAPDADEEAALGDLLRTNFGRGKRLREAWTARALVDLNPQIVRALLDADIPVKAFPELGGDGLGAFLHDLPTASALFELRYRRQRDANQPWTVNDIRDLHALSVAVVHCDVVVTERHWRHLVRDAKLDIRHGTTVLDDVADLPAAIVPV